MSSLQAPSFEKETLVASCPQCQSWQSFSLEELEEAEFDATCYHCGEEFNAEQAWSERQKTLSSVATLDPDSKGVSLAPFSRLHHLMTPNSLAAQGTVHPRPARGANRLRVLGEPKNVAELMEFLDRDSQSFDSIEEVHPSYPRPPALKSTTDEAPLYSPWRAPSLPEPASMDSTEPRATAPFDTDETPLYSPWRAPSLPEPVSMDSIEPRATAPFDKIARKTLPPNPLLQEDSWLRLDQAKLLEEALAATRSHSRVNFDSGTQPTVDYFVNRSLDDSWRASETLLNPSLNDWERETLLSPTQEATRWVSEMPIQESYQATKPSNFVHWSNERVLDWAQLAPRSLTLLKDAERPQIQAPPPPFFHLL